MIPLEWHLYAECSEGSCTHSAWWPWPCSLSPLCSSYNGRWGARAKRRTPGWGGWRWSGTPCWTWWWEPSTILGIPCQRCRSRPLQPGGRAWVPHPVCRAATPPLSSGRLWIDPTKTPWPPGLAGNLSKPTRWVLKSRRRRREAKRSTALICTPVTGFPWAEIWERTPDPQSRSLSTYLPIYLSIYLSIYLVHTGLFQWELTCSIIL